MGAPSGVMVSKQDEQTFESYSVPHSYGLVSHTTTCIDSRSVVVNVLDCNIVVSEFELLVALFSSLSN